MRLVADDVMVVVLKKDTDTACWWNDPRNDVVKFL
jgi:hypothetical protein